MTKLLPKQISATGGVTGQTLVIDDTGVFAIGESSGTGASTLGPENLQYDTIDVNAYLGQSDAGLRLSIPSHVAGDEATHPSVKRFPAGWNGWRYWMAFTPYTGGDDAVEDPCIAVSQDGTHWQTPAGLTNPLDDQGANGVYNSDTELIVSTDGTTLYCLWRTVDATYETLYLRSTTDGITWTAKQQILQVTKASANTLSPTIQWDGTQWVMWAVDAVPTPNTLTRRTAAALTGPWSAPTVCTVNGLPSGRDLWHVSVIKLGAQYIGLLNDCASGSNGGAGRLYLMRSTDGTTWTLGTTQLISASLSGNYDALYRGCLVPTFEDGRLELDMWHGAWVQSPIKWGIYSRRLTQKSSGGSTTTGITVQDENGTVATGVTQLDFQGAGVTAAAGTGEVIVTVPGTQTGYREALMASGVSFPAEPLEASSGGDWLYGEVSA